MTLAASGWTVAAESVGLVGVGVAAWSVVRTLRSRRIGADVLALLALVGALAIGEALAAAVITVMLLTGLGLDAHASRRAGRELEALVRRQPTSARRRSEDGLELVPVSMIVTGDDIVVATADVIPVDGILLDATAVIDESAVTGEPLPKALTNGAAVASGTVNAGPPFAMKATATSDESTYAGIVRLASSASAVSAPLVRIADQVALGFLGAGLAIAGVAWITSGDLTRAVAVLVVATPCPLILAVPIAISSGLSLSASRGVIVKGGAVLEALGRATSFLFDKTGTLTTGRPEVASVVGIDGQDSGEILALAAAVEQMSSHVIAAGIVRGATERGLTVRSATAVSEDAGNGAVGVVDGRRVRIGQSAWMGAPDDLPVLRRATRVAGRIDGSVVTVEVEGVVIGALVLSDRIRPEAARTIRRLRHLGVRRISLVTGDRRAPAEVVGTLADVDEVLAARSPEEKVAAVAEARQGGVVVMVGDGINDAPALAVADVGIAMGGRGGSAATESADVVLGLDRLDRVADVVAIAQRSRRIARQSAAAGLALSTAAMIVAATGALPPAWGALVQEGIDVAVILNALRARRTPRDLQPLADSDAAMARRFGSEHAMLRPRLDLLLELADDLGTGPEAGDIAPARRALRLLRDEIEPHELAEANDLYPLMDDVLGGTDPTGSMARGHVEITRLIDRLAALIDDIDRPGDGVAEPVDPGDLNELRRLLYGLHAVLVLHNSQEDEGYLSLVDPA